MSRYCRPAANGSEGDRSLMQENGRGTGAQRCLLKTNADLTFRLRRMAEQVPYGYQSLPRKEEQVDGKLSIYNKNG